MGLNNSRLNLGCGFGKDEGYINCDILPECNPDMIVDLEKPLPFKSESVEEVKANQIFEHIHNFVELMIEIHRVLKRGGKLYASVPFFPCRASVADPDHCRFFVPESFDMFCDPTAHPYFKGVGLFRWINCKVSNPDQIDESFFNNIQVRLQKAEWVLENNKWVIKGGV